MGCADTCMYGGYYGDPATVVSQRVIRARKPQTCCECLSPIKPGDEYEFVSGCWDGSWSSYRTCLVCREIRNTFCCDGYVYGLLRETVEESMFECWRREGPFDWLAKVSDGAGARLKGWYAEQEER